MKIRITENSLIVTREAGDPRYYGDYKAAGESRLLYKIVRTLRKMGYDAIKKRMCKDGHLVDDLQQYIRMRDGCWCAYNDHWAIRGLNDDFNEGEARLCIVRE